MKDTKTKILEAASALFLKGGLSALSVRAIASRAGVSTIGIYSYFQGKQGILDTLYIEGFDRVAEAMKATSAQDDVTVAILDGVRRYLDIAEGYAAHYNLIFGESDPDYLPSPAAQKSGRDAFQALVSLTSRVLPVNASLREKQEFAVGIWALTHGFVGLRHNAINELLETRDWRAMVLKAIAMHIQAHLAAERLAEPHRKLPC